MKVYLDDVREAPEGWIRTWLVRDTIQLLRSGLVTHLSLDHDLGDEDVMGTGYDVLTWLEEQVMLHGFIPPEITVHSANAGARPKMEQAIKAIENFTDERVQDSNQDDHP